MFFKYDDKVLINLDNLRMVCIDSGSPVEPIYWHLTFHYTDGSKNQTPSTRDFQKVRDAFRTIKNNLKVIG